MFIQFELGKSLIKLLFSYLCEENQVETNKSEDFENFCDLTKHMPIDDGLLELLDL